jgi:hypothetical protein
MSLDVLINLYSEAITIFSISFGFASFFLHIVLHHQGIDKRAEVSHASVSYLGSREFLSTKFPDGKKQRETTENYKLIILFS